MTDAYRTIAAPVTASLEVKRSVFQCDLSPVVDEKGARAAVDFARKTFWDARHHCSAFVLGAERDLRRSSDDGEPSGTAGMPMLDALTAAELTDVVAVVTRWFGGTLLGTGGLVKAYGDAVRAAIAQAQVVRHERRDIARTGVGVADVGRIENVLRASGYAIIDVDYAVDPGRACLDVGVPVGELAAASSILAQASGGECTFAVVGRTWTAV